MSSKDEEGGDSGSPRTKERPASEERPPIPHSPFRGIIEKVKTLAARLLRGEKVK